MAELKTKKNNSSVSAFINSVDDEQKRKDSLELLKIFEEIAKEKPKMWGSSIIGFGEYHYKSERSRQEGDWMLTGFSPRKANISLYMCDGGLNNFKDLLEKLGPHKTGSGCLYIKRLSDVDEKILRKIIKEAFKEMKKRHH